MNRERPTWLVGPVVVSKWSIFCTVVAISSIGDGVWRFFQPAVIQSGLWWDELTDFVATVLFGGWAFMTYRKDKAAFAARPFPEGLADYS